MSYDQAAADLNWDTQADYDLDQEVEQLQNGDKGNEY